MTAELRGIHLALVEQNDLLHRLADHFAPVAAVVDRDSIRQDTGLSFLDPLDAALAQDYIDRTTRDTGHVPDEDEILIYLADEKTTDLHKRLTEREAEMARLMEARR